MKSKLYVDVKSGSNKEGASIIQFGLNNDPNQQWRIENQGKDLYLIRTCMEGNLCLGIKGNSTDLGAELVLCKE